MTEKEALKQMRKPMIHLGSFETNEKHTGKKIIRKFIRGGKEDTAGDELKLLDVIIICIFKAKLKVLQFTATNAKFLEWKDKNIQLFYCFKSLVVPK